jgi:hypothetical protein
MSSIFLKSGSLKIGASQKLKMTVSSLTLDFSYSNDNKWLFNISDLGGEVLNDLNAGYEIQIQLVRYQPKGGYNNYGTPNRTAVSNNRFKTKPSYPNFIDLILPTSIPADKKARVNITSYQSSSFQNMDLTTWVNNMIKYESSAKQTSLRLRGLGFKVTDDVGYWFSKFRFIILINNKKFALTNKTLQMNYYNAGNINSVAISNVVQTSNLITINVG